MQAVKKTNKKGALSSYSHRAVSIARVQKSKPTSDAQMK
jgi:hypothetical protein